MQARLPQLYLQSLSQVWRNGLQEHPAAAVRIVKEGVHYILIQAVPFAGAAETLLERRR